MALIRRIKVEDCSLTQPQTPANLNIGQVDNVFHRTSLVAVIFVVMSNTGKKEHVQCFWCPDVGMHPVIIRLHRKQMFCHTKQLCQEN